MRQAWLAGLLLGCPSNAPEPHTPGTCFDEPLQIELGVGEAAFSPLEEGEPVTMVHGPQGGWHVDVAARVHHVGAYVSIRPTLRLLDTGDRIAGDQEAEYVELDDWAEESCSGSTWGKRAYLDDQPTDQPFICSLAGRTAILSVEIVDLEDERTGEAHGEVTLALDPNDEPWCR